MTGTLKCSACKSLTRHALLRDDHDPAVRDNAEHRQFTIDGSDDELCERVQKLTGELRPSDLNRAELRAFIVILGAVSNRVRGTT
jgi:hypothetical protein